MQSWELSGMLDVGVVVVSCFDDVVVGVGLVVVAVVVPNCSSFHITHILCDHPSPRRRFSQIDYNILYLHNYPNSPLLRYLGLYSPN